MQTFRLFMLLVKRNLLSVVIYLVIFVIIAILGAATVQDTQMQLYQDEAIGFTVQNRDNSRLGEEIKAYLSEKNDYIEVSDDLSELRDAMFYREIYYALIVPEGYEEAVCSGKSMALENYKVQDSAMGYYLDMAVDGYLSVLRAYLAAGFEPEEAMEKTRESLKTSAEVTVYNAPFSEKAASSQTNAYFRYLSYIMLAVIPTTLGSILLIFHKDKVYQRMLCSSLSFRARNTQLALGTVVFGIAIWFVFEVIALIMYHGAVSAYVFLAYGMNMFCFVVLCVALSVMLAFLTKTTQIISSLSVIISLGMSFLGGVFVPMEIMGGSILKIVKFMPTYWYVTVNDVILDTADSVFQKNAVLWRGMGVQILFAAVFFSIAMVASKRRKFV